MPMFPGDAHTEDYPPRISGNPEEGAPSSGDPSENSFTTSVGDANVRSRAMNGATSNGDQRDALSRAQRPPLPPDPKQTHDEQEQNRSHQEDQAVLSKLEEDLMTLNEEQLRRRLAAAELRAAAAEGKLHQWELAAKQLFNTCMLSPKANQRYKSMCENMLKDVLKEVEQVEFVRYVQCSFPSVPNEAPQLQLKMYETLERSEWHMSWSPSWTVEVALEGRQAFLPFKLVVYITAMTISGNLQCSFTSDLSVARVHFTEFPEVGMKVNSHVNLGTVPLPLQAVINSKVETSFNDWLSSRLVHPNKMTFHPEAFQKSNELTDEDMESAKEAAMAMLQRNSPHG